MKYKTWILISLGIIILVGGVFALTNYVEEGFVLKTLDSIKEQGFSLFAEEEIPSNSPITLTPFDKSPPNFDSYQVTIDNGLKISYDDWYVTFQPYFFMNDSSVKTWSEIPESIQKNLWKKQITPTKYKYGADFSNVSTNVKNNLKFVVLHVSDHYYLDFNETTNQTTTNTFFDHVVKANNSIIIDNIVTLSHDDLLKSYTLIVNKSDIVIGNLTSNWIENGDGTWNISFDPTIELAGDVSYASLDTNITQETGFAHLNISSVAPYNALVFYTPLDSNVSTTTVYDYSKEGNDGTITGAVFNSSGFIGGAYDFNSDDWIDAGSDVSLELDEFAISIWINSEVGQESGSSLFAKGESGVNALNNYMCTYHADVRWKCFIGNETDTDTVIYGSVQPGEWTHFVFMVNSSHLNIFVNGVRESTGLRTLTGTLAGSGNKFLIGALRTTANQFNGSIDEVMIFNRSLTAQEISDIYNNQSARFVNQGTQRVRAGLITNTTTWNNNGDNRLNLTVNHQENMASNLSLRVGQMNFSVDPIGLVAYYPFEWNSASDISGEGNDGTVTGAIFNSSGGLNDTGGYEFDGIDDTINLGSDSNLDNLSNYTYIAWIKINELTASRQGILVKDGIFSQGGLYITSGGRLAGIRTYSVSNADSRSDAFAISTGVWQFIAMTNNGSTNGTIGLYHNGQEVIYNTLIPGNGNINTDASDNLYISEVESAGRAINGSIDEVMIFNRSLSADEISAIYLNQSAKFNVAYYTPYQNLTDPITQYTINKEADFVFPDFKYFAGNSTSNFYTPLLIGNITMESFSVAEGPDITSPVWSLNSTNSTLAGTNVLHSLKWEDDIGLDGYIFSFCDGDWNGSDCDSQIETTYTSDILGDGTTAIGLPNSDYSANEWISLGNDSNGPDRCNLQYNLSFIKDKNITSAYVNLYIYDAGNGLSVGQTMSLYIYEVNNHTWSEDDGLTWNTQPVPKVNLLDTILIDNDTRDEWVSFNVTSWVINNSLENYNETTFFINTSVNDNDDLVRFRTKEYTADVSIVHNLTIIYLESVSTFTNDSFVPMTGTTNWSNVTKLITNNVNVNVSWCVYANDSSNNWNISSCNNPFVYVTTTVADTEFPIFSNFIDNNGSLIDSGIGTFNVTMLSTNGTVLLEIDGVNITATNTSGEVDVFNASHTFSSSGTFIYRWNSWGNGTDTNFNKSGDQSYTVNDSGDIEFPIFSSFTENPGEPFNYINGQTYKFNTSVLSTNGTVGIEFNGTNFTASNTTADVYNITFNDLSAGNYTYYWWGFGNGTDNNFNLTTIFSYNISRAISEGNITNDTTLTREYDETNTNIGLEEGNLGDGDVTYIIFKNGISVGTSDIEGGVGIFEYILNTTGGTNYTLNSSMDNRTLTITQNDTYVINLAGTSPIDYGTVSDFQGTLCPTQLACNLTRDGVNVSNPDTELLSAGTYNYQFNATTNTNYSATNTSQLILTVNQIVPQGSITGTSPINYLTAGNVQGSEANTNDSDVTYTLFRDNIAVSNPDITVLAVGTYQYIFNATAGTNYSNNKSIGEFTLIVNPINTTLDQVEFKIEETIFNSATYIELLNATFNLTSTEHITVKGVGAVRKTQGAPSNTLYLKLTINGEVLFDTAVRSVTNTQDRGVFTIPINHTEDELPAGVNNITLEAREVGVGPVNLSSLEIFLDTDMSSLGNEINYSHLRFDDTFTNSSYTNIVNFTHRKNINSSTLIDVQHTFSSSGNAKSPECYLINNITSEQTPTYNRYLVSAGNTGSSGLVYISQIKTNVDESWELWCKSNDNIVIFNNVTFYSLSLTEEDGNIINNFQNTTPGILSVSGNDNLIMSYGNYPVGNGTEIHLSATIIIQSTTGAQVGDNSPTIFINSSNLSESNCFHSYQRSLSGNTDIGTIKMYVNCNGTNPGDLYDFNVYASISGGETIDVLNGSFNAFEVSMLDIATGIVAPTVTIDIPFGVINVSGLIEINASVNDPSNFGWSSNVTLLNESFDFATAIYDDLGINNNVTNTTFDTTSIADGKYVIIWNVTGLGGTTSDDENITIDNTNPDILILFPANNTNTTNINQDVNYTVSDTNLASCWYSNDTMSSNITLTGCANITAVIWAEGLHNVTVWANDTIGNENKSSITFRIDTTPPVFSPALANQTIPETNSLSYNIDAVDAGIGVESFNINDTFSGLFIIDLVTGVLSNDSTLIGQTGEYLMNVSVNDTLGNLASGILLINVTPVDNVNPDITIIFPTNNTNSSNVNLDVNYTASDDVSLSTCWFSNDTMLVNTTLASCSTNITTIVWSEGIHNVTVWVNDTSNNINLTSVTFKIDTIAPDVLIIIPPNNTNTTNINQDVNYTRSGDAVSCWYSNDTMSANTTLAGCGNITDVVWVEGLHNVSIWVNDSVGNENKSSVTFGVDSINPNIVIIFPINNTDSTNVNLNVNYSASDSGFGLSVCWFSNDTMLVNTTLASCGTNITTVVWSIGIHNVTIWANDTFGNENRSSVSFNITVADVVPPDILIQFPSNNTNTTNINLNVNYTANDTNLESCWFSNDTMLVNTTLTNCGINITTIVWSEGIHNVTVWANDTTGNENRSSVSFRIDTTAPIITLQNFSQEVNLSFSETMVATDSGIGVSTYGLNDTSIFNISQVGLITNVSNLSRVEIHYLNISVNDTLGNLASGIFFINITKATGDDPRNIQEWVNYITRLIVVEVDNIGNMWLGGSLNITKGLEIGGLRGSYTNGEAYICIYDNGSIFSKDSACS